MEFDMFEHVFQDLKAVEDAVAFFFSNASSELGSDECFTYAHNHLYHSVNFFGTSSLRFQSRKHRFEELYARSHP